MPGRLEFELPLSKSAHARKPARGDDPMRLLLLGDFAAEGQASTLAQRSPLRVDIDNADAVMQRLAPKLTISVGDEACAFEPQGIDDFHPDRLIELLPPLARLRDLRARLQHPATFPKAAAELAQPQGLAPAGEAPAPTAATGADLLGSLLGGKPAAASPAAPATAPAAKGGIDALLRQIVAPHVRPDAPAQQAQYVAAVEATLSEQLRSVLHAPAFQRLEAAWRGVHWLLSRLELDDALQLHLFDLRLPEFVADLARAQGQPAQTALHATLVDQVRGQPGAMPWAAAACLFDFGAAPADLAALAALGLLGQQASASMLVGVAPSLMGLTSFADAAATPPAPMPGWQLLRQSEAAPWIAAAAPRVLMRLPYGKRRDPVQAFAFEEFTAAPDHEQLLWCPGSLVLAQVLGRSFMADGWAGQPAEHADVDALPALSFERDGEPQLQACAEFHLGEAAAVALAGEGLVVLQSHRRQAELRLLRLQSMASPPAALAGPIG